MKILLKISGIIAMLLVISCKTYTVSTESFKEQMINSSSSTMKEVKIKASILPGKITYNSNNIERIIVTDKEGDNYYLTNSPSIEMRVTHNNGKKYMFYFDTVILENDTLKGGRSRFINATRAIPMDSIVKIEIQDGGKNYKYKN